MKRRGAALSTGGLRALDVKIDDDGVLTASHHDSLTGFIGSSVDLLVRHVWRNIDEIAGPGLTAEFQVVSPSHAGPAANDVEDGLQVAVVVGTSLRVGLDYNRAGPQFGRSGSGMGDGGGPGHTGGLRRIRIQVAGGNDFDAVVLPVHAFHDNRFSKAANCLVMCSDWLSVLGAAIRSVAKSR